ncbi:MAG: hypothetical protein J0L72_04170 [Armatimonadetes bacterium]|nr:hypothetical protein [Armatimonadota bacterium]
MNWEEIFKAWGLPALVGAATGLATLLLNRRLPFQQQLNELQLQELNSRFKDIVLSTRGFNDHLYKVIYLYAEIKEAETHEREALRQELFQSFLVPEYIAPVQEFMFSLVAPDAVIKAAAEYQLAMAALPVMAMNLIDTVGPDVAWQTVMHQANQPLDMLAKEIRNTLGINDLTEMNRYHSLSTRTRFHNWLRMKQNKLLRRVPASPYESLLFSTQMAKLRAVVEADLGSGEDQPTVNDLMGQPDGATDDLSTGEAIKRTREFRVQGDREESGS